MERGTRGATRPQERDRQDPRNCKGKERARGIRGAGHLLAKGVPGRRLHGPRFLLVLFGAVLPVRPVGWTEIPSARGGGALVWISRARAGGRRASERIGRGGGEDGRKGWLVMRARARCADVFGEGEASGRVAWSTGRPARARSAAQVPSRPRCRCHQSPRLAKFTSSPVLHHCCRVFLLSGCLIWIMPKQPVHSF